MNFHTIIDYKDKLKGKRVFVRIDTNATLENGYMPLTQRVEYAFETLKFLVQQEAIIIAATHNGRKGEVSFVSVPPLFLLLKEKYKDKLSKEILDNIICIGNTYDSKKLGLNNDTIKLIKSLKPKQILILENIRFLENETAKLTREDFAKEKFIKDLIEAGIEYYVLDGFSVAHRSHMSIVGFKDIPNLAGLSLKKELEGSKKVKELLEKNKKGEAKVVFLLGGVKLQDYMDLIEVAVKENTVDKILIGGLLAQLCFYALGKELGENSKKPLYKKDSKGRMVWDEKDRILNLLQDYKEKFVLPIDVAFEMPNGERKDYEVDKVPQEVKENGTILDIGEKTIEKYKEILSQSTMAYWKGPLGAYDKNEKFAKGSYEILNYLKENKNIFSVMGGGDTGQMLQHFNVSPKELGYVSLSGGALIQILAGKKLPGIEALEYSYQKFPL